MQNEYLQRMIDYHYWAQNKVWGCIMPLTEEQLHYDPGYSVGSLYRHLLHTYAVERTWYHIICGERADDPKYKLDLKDFPTREAIRERWDTLEVQVRVWVETASDEQLNRTVYQTFADPPLPSKAWESVIYMVTHAADHRSQILRLIHDLGGETVMQDFIRYVWGIDDQSS